MAGPARSAAGRAGLSSSVLEGAAAAAASPAPTAAGGDNVAHLPSEVGQAAGRQQALLCAHGHHCCTGSLPAPPCEQVSLQRVSWGCPDDPIYRRAPACQPVLPCALLALPAWTRKARDICLGSSHCLRHQERVGIMRITAVIGLLREQHQLHGELWGGSSLTPLTLLTSLHKARACCTA